MLNRIIALAITAVAVAATPVAAAAPVSCKVTPGQIRTLAEAKGGEQPLSASGAAAGGSARRT